MATMTADERPQHLVAMDRANEIRLARAKMKRDLGAGEVTVAEALERPEAETMPLIELLCALPRWGRTRSVKMLTSLGLRERKPAGSLTARQRDELLHALAKRGVE